MAFLPGNSRVELGPWRPSSSSQMGPQHPLLFLETAGDLDVNVLRREVVFASVDAASNLGNRHAGAVSERLQEKIFPMFIKRERRKRRFLHRPSIVPCEVPCSCTARSATRS